MSTNLFILKKVEALTGTKLEKVSVDDIFSQKNGFVLDESENIIGLNLESLNLTDISFLKNLTSLKQLILKGNQINDISILKNLESLTVLDLSQNEISDVSCLKDLFHLRRLYLDFNQIKILPKEIAFLKNLEYFSINGNPLEIPPYSDANAGLESIRNFFRKNDRDETDPPHPAQHRLQVFLGYSHENKEAVRPLYFWLRDCGVEPWFDVENILPGQDWELEITKAVKNSDVVIFCLSKGSVNKKGFIQKEIKLALDIADEQPEGSIFLISLKLEECIVPERLRRWQWVDWFEQRGYEKLFLALKTRANELNASPILLPVLPVPKSKSPQSIPGADIKVKRKKIFISYSHEDKKWLERVQKNLSTLKHEGFDIDVWADTQIKPGMKWEEEISKALGETKIAILLISSDFLASDSIRNNILPPLLKAAENERVIILPLIITPSRFEKDKNLSQFQPVNNPGRESLISLNKGEQERILLKLVNRIEEILSIDNSRDE